MPPKLGKQGEQIALRYLLRTRHQILEYNWASKLGEVDLIAVRDHSLIIVEVKTRTDLSEYRFPAHAAVDDEKQRRLRMLAQRYQAQHRGRLRGLAVRTVRFDVIAVIIEGPFTSSRPADGN